MAEAGNGTTAELIEALAAHVGGLLSSAKRPRTWELVAEPLRDDAGKVRRAALRAERERERGAGTAQS